MYGPCANVLINDEWMVFDCIPEFFYVVVAAAGRIVFLSAFAKKRTHTYEHARTPTPRQRRQEVATLKQEAEVANATHLAVYVHREQHVLAAFLKHDRWGTAVGPSRNF